MLKLTSFELKQFLALMFLGTVVLWGQIQNEVLHSVDGIVYALVGKELFYSPLWSWGALTWKGSLFYEHPPLMMWLLGISFKLFGVGTTQAVVVPTALSTLTLSTTYFLGRRLVDHRYGILAAAVLILTPQFVKNGRNPMLEPALMLFLMLAIWFFFEQKRVWLSGVFFGLAFLSKGPPAFLFLAVVLGFWSFSTVFPKYFSNIKISASDFSKRLVIVVLLGFIPVALADLWHFALEGKSFFGEYFRIQLKAAILHGRASVIDDPFFYLKVFFRYWPWWPFVLLGCIWGVYRRDRKLIPAITIGFLVGAGAIFGFSILKQKASWYLTFYYSGMALLAAVPIYYWFSAQAFKKYFSSFCLILAIPTLFLSASFPSLFLHFERRLEVFLDRAGTYTSGQLAGRKIRDCIPLNEWRGRFYTRFHFDAELTNCEDSKSEYMFLNLKEKNIPREFKIRYSYFPFALLEKK